MMARNVEARTRTQDDARRRQLDDTKMMNKTNLFKKSLCANDQDDSS